MQPLWWLPEANQCERRMQAYPSVARNIIMFVINHRMVCGSVCSVDAVRHVLEVATADADELVVATPCAAPTSRRQAALRTTMRLRLQQIKWNPQWLTKKVEELMHWDQYSDGNHMAPCTSMSICPWMWLVVAAKLSMAAATRLSDAP